MGKIWIVGLGPGGVDTLPPTNLAVLKRRNPVYLRTDQHPIADWLRHQDIGFSSFDYLYAEKLTFAEVYEAIVGVLLEKASGQAEVSYAVPGHPLVAESTVQRLLSICRSKGTDVAVEILPAMSCLDAVFAALNLDPADGLVITEASSISPTSIQSGLGLLILQVYNRLMASQVKLDLMQVYGDEWEVILIQAGGTPDQRIVHLPLYQIDRQDWIDHLTTIYVPPVRQEDSLGPPGAFSTLVSMMDRLRGPGGCPWDRQQNHASLRRYLLEETYEVLEALDQADMCRLEEELGDLLLQIVFHAKIAQDNGHFNIRDVVAGINGKVYRRHPHVFGGAEARTAEEVEKNWRQIKRLEKPDRGERLLNGIPKEMPALARAQKLTERAATVGFDWPDINGVWDKIKEEAGELQQALEHDKPSEVESELGDLLLSVVNLARFAGVDAEEALRVCLSRFTQRFGLMEDICRREGKQMNQMTPAELDYMWERAKDLCYKNFPG